MSATNEETPTSRSVENARYPNILVVFWATVTLPIYQKLIFLVNYMQKDAMRHALESSIVRFTTFLSSYDESLSFAPQGLR